MLRGDLSAWLGWWPERLPVADVFAAWRSAIARRGQAGSPATIQLYLHFAFCQASCVFCQYFHVVPRETRQFEGYADYLAAVIDRYRAALGRTEVSNAYFGGGTPSALPARQLARVLEAFERTFRVKREFTCEAHPGNLDEEKLDLLQHAGVNRLSMGLQSFDSDVLKRIGRINPPRQRVRELVHRARRLGMWTNTDLVLGLPGQTAASFHTDLDHVLAEVRPDCLTVYRYQPVPGLPEVPPEAMRYSRVLQPRLLARALRLGYLPATTGGDDRSGKDFFRNSMRTWAQWATRVRYETMRLMRMSTELPTYALYENNESHLLGIGPGALSHVYGHSWHREATAVAGLSATSEPVYVGTRLTAEDECRSALSGAFAAGRWIDARALGRRSGVDVDARFGGVLREAVRDGTLRRFARWHAGAPGIIATDAPVFEKLLPRTPMDVASRAQRAGEVDALRSNADVQTELISIGDHLATSAAPSGDGSGSRPSEALTTWAALIGLGQPGQHFADAIVERVDGSEAHFRILPAPAPALRIRIEHERGQPAFLKVGPYAISYAGRNGAPLAPLEERFLRELGVRTAQAAAAQQADG
jgi:oxygen-independent coproporphyrinogen-3 oxidase